MRAGRRRRPRTSTGPRTCCGERDADLIHAYFGPVAWRALELRRRLGIPLVVTFLGDDIAPSRRAVVVVVDPGGTRSRRTGRPACASCSRAATCSWPRGRTCATRLIELRLPAGEGAAPADGASRSTELPVPRPPPGPAGRAGDRVRRPLLRAEGRARTRSRRCTSCAREGRELEFRLIGDETMTEGGYAARVYAYIREHGLERLRARARLAQQRPLLRGDAATATSSCTPAWSTPTGASEGGAPTTILEAQALGMPVVSTLHCDIPYVTRARARAPLLVPERDRPRWRTRCGRCWTTRSAGRRWGARGARTSRPTTTSRARSGALEDRYLALLGDDRDGAHLAAAAGACAAGAHEPPEAIERHRARAAPRRARARLREGAALPAAVGRACPLRAASGCRVVDRADAVRGGVLEPASSWPAAPRWQRLLPELGLGRRPAARAPRRRRGRGSGGRPRCAPGSSTATAGATVTAHFDAHAGPPTRSTGSASRAPRGSHRSSPTDELTARLADAARGRRGRHAHGPAPPVPRARRPAPPSPGRVLPGRGAGPRHAPTLVERVLGVAPVGLYGLTETGFMGWQCERREHLPRERRGVHRRAARGRPPGAARGAGGRGGHDLLARTAPHDPLRHRRSGHRRRGAVRVRPHAAADGSRRGPRRRTRCGGRDHPRAGRPHGAASRCRTATSCSAQNGGVRAPRPRPGSVRRRRRSPRDASELLGGVAVDPTAGLSSRPRPKTPRRGLAGRLLRRPHRQRHDRERGVLPAPGRERRAVGDDHVRRVPDTAPGVRRPSSRVGRPSARRPSRGPRCRARTRRCA